MTTKHAWILTVALVATAAALSGGCEGPIRGKSRQLAIDLATFRDAQSKKLAQLNSTFDQSYRRSLTLLEQAKADELRLDRDRDAQRIADAIVADTNNGLRSTFRDSLADQIVAQRKRIAEADQSIELARKRYGDAYKQTTLSLGKLDAVIDQLRILGREQDKLAEFYKFASALDKVYRGLQDEQAKAASMPPAATAEVPPAAGVGPKPKVVTVIAPIQRIQMRNQTEERATPDNLK